MSEDGDLRRRLRLGPENDAAWLTVAEVAKLFSTPHRPVSRHAVDRWLKAPVSIEGVRYVVRYKSPPSGRICHPDDIAALLEASERVRSADDAGAPRE
ncbi:hypothetical protein [Micromonospora sp. DT227]|uniref:hypothetical protein n=1 Tax=Micromonospora sp. DT227 TaxID=3393433 RepID=UPI003CF02231